MENTLIGSIQRLIKNDNIQLAVAYDNGVRNILIERNVVNYYFCVNGEVTMNFGPQYSRKLPAARSYLIFNPERDLPVSLVLSGGCRLVILDLTLQHLHTLFTHEPLPFLRPENINRKFYDEKEISPALLLVLNQLFVAEPGDNTKSLYYQGKVLEILSLYFSSKSPDSESCPFLKDEEIMRKIKTAKDYLLKHLNDPPTIKALSRIIGLNEFQLKTGFKEVYGHTVYGYLLDHKLTHARLLLDKGRMRVNEVAREIGYKNTSHFISAFRKKFGLTPKKYLMNVRVL